jgi:hypothetical protein
VSDKARREALDRVLAEDAERVRASCERAPSLWPGVRARLHERTRAARSPRLGLAMSLTASTAAVAGLLLGVLLGPRIGLFGGEDTQTVATSTSTQDEWGNVGSLIADGSSTTLDDVYLSVNEEGGGEK